MFKKQLFILNLFKNICIILFSCTISLANRSNNNVNNITDYNYEKMHMYGLGRRVIPNFRRLNPRRDYGYNNGEEHPQPLPEPKPTQYIAGPYQSIFQGRRRPGEDFRAFINRFEYNPLEQPGQRYFCEARMYCIISYLAVRTDNGIPILMRGGVGYSHLYVIARPRRGKYMNGSVQAYCLKNKTASARRYQYEIVGKPKVTTKSFYELW